MKNTYNLFLLISFNILFSAYEIGDHILEEHQNIIFNDPGYCYPESKVANSFSFSDYNGNLNGGDFKVLMIECFSKTFL